jgi:hypothetical protein
MARYYFDFRDGVTILDETGRDLATISDVKRAAGEKMADFLMGSERRPWVGDDWSINVRTESGALALIMTLTSTETGHLH